MKIGYLIKGLPFFVERIPPEVDAVVIHTDDNGRYRPEDLVRLADVEALLVTGQEPVNDQLLDACPKVKIVQKTGVGYESFDLEATRRRGIPACNEVGANSIAVAEHVLSLILALAKRLIEAHTLTNQARWVEARNMYNDMFELAGRTLGIIGLGDIGGEIARRARVFGMKIIYNNRKRADPTLEAELEARYLEKDELYAASDYICISTPFNDSTRGMIDARAIALMKPSSYLVCIARGGIIDEAALREALDAERLAGAGIDVFSVEPVVPDNPLLGARNIIVTSHMAGLTGDTKTREMAWAHENIRRVVEQGKKPKWVVNGVT